MRCRWSRYLVTSTSTSTSTRSSPTDFFPASSPLNSLRSFVSVTSHRLSINNIKPNHIQLDQTPATLGHPVLAQGGGTSAASFYVSESLCLELLSHCNSRALEQGICVHSPIIKLGLHGHLLLNNRLLALYSKCEGGGVYRARKLFDGLPCRDVVSWTALISAFARSGLHEEALDLFDQMLMSGASPNHFTFSTILRCASSLGALHLGASVHAAVIKLGNETNAVLGSALMGLYSKCGRLQESSRVFGLMDYRDRDAVSWTTMISASARAEDWSGTMQLYASMLESGVFPNEFTFANLLGACGSLGQFGAGELVHAHLILLGADLNNLVLKTALVDMYSKCHRMRDALRVVRLTPESDVTLWTAVVSGYNQAGDYAEAIAAFREMEDIAGVSPNCFTYSGILHACSCLVAPDLGKQFHSRAVKSGLDRQASVGSALVDLHAKLSDDVEDLVRAFEAIDHPNVVSWTTLIAGLVRHGREREALEVFTEMRAAGVQPNSFTLSTVLKGLGCCQAFAHHTRKLHALVLKAATPPAEEEETVVGNSLVGAYAGFGRGDDAWKVASRMPRRDVLTYTSLAKGLNQIGLHREALGMIARMRDEDVRMDGFSLACFLSASAGLAAIEPGRQLHCYAVKSGAVHLHVHGWISVSNALVDLYGKCGSVDEARMAFTAIPEPNVVSWNGLISGLASNGRFSEALSAFEDMRLAGAGAGVRPDGITFLLVLYACSHGGLADLGVDYFNSMRESYGVPPQPEHYVCLVDLLGRAGRLEEAACTIESMPKPFRSDALVYKTLLSCCKLHGNLVLGECMAKGALERDPCDPAIYVLLAGLYDDAGKAQLGEQTRRMMMDKGLRRAVGQSWMRSS